MSASTKPNGVVISFGLAKSIHSQKDDRMIIQRKNRTLGAIVLCNTLWHRVGYMRIVEIIRDAPLSRFLDV